MLEALKADLAAIGDKITKAVAEVNVLIGQRQGLEHVIGKIKAAASAVKSIEGAVEDHCAESIEVAPATKDVTVDTTEIAQAPSTQGAQ